MKIKICKKVPSKEKLREIYDVCNRLFKDENCFYTSEQIKELKKDNTKIFL